MVVSARRTGLSVSRTAMLLGFSHSTVSRLYQERSTTQSTSSQLYTTVGSIGFNMHPWGMLSTPCNVHTPTNWCCSSGKGACNSILGRCSWCFVHWVKVLLCVYHHDLLKFMNLYCLSPYLTWTISTTSVLRLPPKLFPLLVRAAFDGRRHRLSSCHRSMFHFSFCFVCFTHLVPISWLCSWFNPLVSLSVLCVIVFRVLEFVSCFVFAL